MRFRRRTDPGFEIREGLPRGAALGRDAAFKRALVTADMLAALGALVLVAIAGNDPLQPAAVALLPLLVIASKTSGLYDRDEHVLGKGTLDEATSLFHVAVGFTLLAWLASPLVFAGRLGRIEVVGLLTALLAALAAGRAVARRIALAVTLPERCLVLGDAVAARELTRRIERSGLVNARVVGRVPLDGRRSHGLDTSARPATVPGDPPVLGNLPGLAAVLWAQQIDRVVIAPESDAGSDRLLDKIRLIKAVGVKVTLVPRLLEVVGSAVEFDDVDGMQLLGVRVSQLSRSSRRLKRMLDVTASLTGLILLAPLFAVVAIAIKLDSRGPVFFGQRRVGLWAAEFPLLKFRTMVEDADEQKASLREMNEAEEGFFKIADDPRLTRVGRVLRRLSIDELPQLFNVLRGEMSLVGPRPLVPEEDVHVEGWLRRRLEIQPGMTGVWQVLGSSRVPLRDMVRIDYLYLANWSLWLDLKILLRTVPLVLGRRGQ
ncbi:MAG: exopolysaccharide biosynthesis polyprenyl glycosylphosphotransferase [Thermoleophilaceae bacterium]